MMLNVSLYATKTNGFGGVPLNTAPNYEILNNYIDVSMFYGKCRYVKDTV